MAVLADFKISTEYKPGVPREVRVIVYSDVKAMRAATARYVNSGRASRHRRRGGFQDLLGICHRWSTVSVPSNEEKPGALVRYAKPHIGVGIISHEMTHAAVNIHNCDGDSRPLTDENDEPFAWILGDLVRQTINELTERQVYD